MSPKNGSFSEEEKKSRDDDNAVVTTSIPNMSKSSSVPPPLKWASMESPLDSSLSSTTVGSSGDDDSIVATNKSGGGSRLASIIAGGGAIAAALLAASVGAVAKAKPELFMSLPFPLSVILWTAAAGGELPPYFSPDAWAEDEIKTWTRPGDAIVSVGAKSGTNWMLYCSHQIRMKGSDDADELFEDVSLATPWMDLRQSRGGSWSEQKERYNTTVLPDGTPLREKWDNDRYPFRIFKSHYGPKKETAAGGEEEEEEGTGGVFSLESNRHLKFVTMARDGMDVVNSMVPFFDNHREEFRKLWGGFPPASTGNFDVDAETRLSELLPGGMLSHLYWGYIRSWWPVRNEPNVLLLHYADAKRDLRGTVKKMAKFFGVRLSGSELSTVVDRCGIDHMKSVSHMFDYRMPLNTDLIWDNERYTIMKPETLIREGKVGGHRGRFSEDQIRRWREAEEEVFGDDPKLLKWARNGGSYA